MTNADYFQSVLQKIGVLAESESPSAEQSATMLDVMNDLRGSLAADGIDLGIAPQTSATDTLLLNEGVREDFKYMLAIRACVEFEKPVPPLVEKIATDGYLRLLRNAVLSETRPATYDHLSSNQGGSFDINRGY